ncbi:MAG: glycosyltransferase family 2 protein [Burkholderiales bacterium]
MRRVPASVVIPCYRCIETIARAVDSILNQTIPPEEILLVEDESGDNGATISALRDLQQLHPDSGIRIIELEKNGGAAAARNAGWDAAKQPYIAFLDADDAWHPKKLEIQYSWMADHPDVSFCGHLIEVVAPDASIDRPAGKVIARKLGRTAWLLSCRFSTISVMLRRDLPFRFSPEMRLAEDYLLWLRIALNGHEAWRIEAPLAFCFKPLYGAGGLTGDLWLAEKGVLNAYGRLLADGLISPALYPPLAIFSILKYLRRILLRFFRQPL